MLSLRQSGADVLVDISIGKQTAQVIRKLADLAWKPAHFVVSTSIGKPILEAAGVPNAIGIISATPYKLIGGGAFADDPEVVAYKAFTAKYMPGEHQDNEIGFIAYSWAKFLHDIIKTMGNDLTVDSLMARFTSLKNAPSVALLPGISYTTTPTDYAPVKRLRLQRFNGTGWDAIQLVGAD